MRADELKEKLQNFEESPLKWRTVFPGVSLSPGSGAFYGAGDLAGFFNNQKNISFKWLFFNNVNSEIFNKLVRSIPLGLIMRHMENLAEPVYTDFIETNEDEEFMEVGEEFYKNLFWNEELYVSKDFFKNPNNYEIDMDEPPIELDYYKHKGGFDTWVKITLKDDDKDERFMHLATSITVKIPDWKDLLIKARWSGNHKANFVNWFEYSMEYCISLKKLVNFSSLLTKRIQVAGTQNIHKYLQDLSGHLETPENYFMSDESNKLDIIPKMFASGADLRDLHYVTFNLLDRRAYELGRVSNTNPKGERLTSGENYKDITSIANRQKAILTQLKLFARKVKAKWGNELNFAINGIPEKQMLETETLKAPNPNTEGTGGTGGMGADAAGVK